MESWCGTIGHSLEALTDVVLCVFPREKLWPLYEKHTGLAFDVTWLTAREENVLGDYLLTVGQRAGGRAHRLRASPSFPEGPAPAAGTCARQYPWRLPLAREHLADTIGFWLVHTPNKSLKRLRRTGAFKWTGTTFEPIDGDKLTDLVGYVAAPGGVQPLI